MQQHQAPIALLFIFLFHGMVYMEVAKETSVFMTLDKIQTFDDKIMMSDILSSQTTLTKMYCALYCVSQSLCLSFFYNKHCKLCQTHSIVFTDATSSLVSVNTSYYHITQGNIVLEPIKYCGEPPTEAGLTWVPGTNYVGSRRQFICPGSLLPTASFVDCMTTGNWTHLSEYCRDVTLASCVDVQTCSSTNVDGTYLLYPPELGGHGVQIYCHDMATDPTAYVTLFEENLFRNDYSKRINSAPCQFQDRNGDAYASFTKIKVNLADMSVIREDMTFATTYQETTRPIPLFGESASCSFDNVKHTTLITSCPAPGVFTINTNGTGLIVDPTLTWNQGGYAPRLESMGRSTDGHVIRAAFDGWCGTYKPLGTMYLQADTNDEQRGIASIPICPDL